MPDSAGMRGPGPNCAGLRCYFPFAVWKICGSKPLVWRVVPPTNTLPEGKASAVDKTFRSPGDAIGLIFQLFPSQCSTRFAKPTPPVAQTLVLETADTALNPLDVPGLGPATDFHARPSQCTVRGKPSLPVPTIQASWEPISAIPRMVTPVSAHETW